MDLTYPRLKPIMLGGASLATIALAVMVVYDVERTPVAMAPLSALDPERDGARGCDCEDTFHSSLLLFGRPPEVFRLIPFATDARKWRRAR